MRNVIILAAGKGTRMKSELSKILHPVLGKPMIKHVIDNLKDTEINRKIIVIGKNALDVRGLLMDEVLYAEQSEQLGTGHAVLMAEPFLKDETGTTLIICGDTPLITPDTINLIIKNHEENRSDATILTAVLDNPTGYGRVIRENNKVVKIVEQKDANDIERAIKEINTGTYCFNNQKLFSALKKVRNDNAQKEYYFTDVIEILSSEGGIINSYITQDFEETIGINDRVNLAKANAILRDRVNTSLMKQGVTIIDPQSTYISLDTKVGNDTVIYPNTIIYGNNIIGGHCVIGPNTELENVTIGDMVTIKHSVITDSSIGNNTIVGPFAHFRNHTIVGDNVRIGNFVEIKNTNFGNNSNAAHLSYIGDAEIGNKVNMGCGSITVNYDGKKKHKTVIGNNVFVGCNSNLIAPITIGNGAYIAAGSTINKDVPDDAFAIAREKQTNKEGYAKKYQK